MKDLVKREGLFYKKFTDVPFTGNARHIRPIWTSPTLALRPTSSFIHLNVSTA
jgi:hypothetical protein